MPLNSIFFKFSILILFSILIFSARAEDISNPSDMTSGLLNTQKGVDKSNLNRTDNLPKSGVQVSFTLKDITFSGNRTVGSDDLKKAVEHYIGQPVTRADLHAIKTLLTRYYISKGYINSGALLRDQVISSGVVDYKIVEGELTHVSLVDDTKLSQKYISKKVNLNDKGILNAKILEKNLILLRNNPNIINLHAQLVPGSRLGESDLRLKVVERDRHNIRIGANNYSSPGVGEAQFNIGYNNTNVFGRSEQVRVDMAQTEGAERAHIFFSAPINAKDYILSISHSRAETEIIEEPFNQLDVISDTHLSSINLEIPLNRSLKLPQTFSVAFHRRKSATELIGRAFSFSPGFVDGKARVSALRLIHNLRSNNTNFSYGLRTQLSVGLDVLGSTINSDQPDSRFTALTSQMILIKNFSASRFQWLFNGSFQVSKDSLLSMEQIAIGGVHTVRGHRENLLVGDKGLLASSEFRYQPFSERDNILLGIFSDYGIVDNQNREFSGDKELWSIGIGLIVKWKDKFYFKLDQGFPLINKRTLGDNLQDDGLHVQFEARLHF